MTERPRPVPVPLRLVLALTLPLPDDRFGRTDRGFHGIVLAGGGLLYIDPDAPGDLVNYVSVSRADMPGRGHGDCELGSGPLTLARTDSLFPFSSGTQKRTCSLATPPVAALGTNQ